MAVFDHSDWFLVLLLKCWDTSHYPKTFRPCVGTLRTVPGPLCSSVGTLRTVPRPSVGTLSTVPRTLTQVLGHFALSHDLHSSFGTLHTVPRLPAQVLGHFVLSQDPLLKSWDTSHYLDLGQCILVYCHIVHYNFSLLSLLLPLLLLSALPSYSKTAVLHSHSPLSNLRV